MPSTSDCAICAKHRGEGTLGGHRVWSDDLVVVFHAPGPVLGHLFVETSRHAPTLADLTEDEAAAAGRVTTVIARTLRDEQWVAAVHTAVAGLAVAHYHQHVFTRSHGTPADVAWHASTDWQGSRRGDDPDIVALCTRLRTALDGPDPLPT